jgi:hypothetical protein
VNHMRSPRACVHCEKPLRQTDTRWVYWMSGLRAHLRCVSLPSAPATDALLYALLS